MGDEHRTERATSFERGVDAYERARPGYPDEVVRWTLGDAPRRVLDLAAGTGKLTARLDALGHDVVAVEPSDGMRAQLTRALPGVTALPGTAEAIPLEDDAVDAVVVAQAWHWLDPAQAQTEIARVLRDRGRLAIVWNVRDQTVPWVAAFTAIVHRGDELGPGFAPPLLDERFSPVEHTAVAWTDRMAAGDLRTLAASRSHLLTLPAAERDALLDEVDELARTHPDLAGRDLVDVPYLTHCYRVDLR